MTNQIADLMTVIDAPESREAKAIMSAREAAWAAKIRNAEVRGHRMARECLSKKFSIKTERGTYHGVISACEFAGFKPAGKSLALTFKLSLKCGEYVNGPFFVTALPR